MLSTIVIVVIIGVVALLGFAASKPDTFQVQRTATMQASPDKVFTLINDFHNWALWSPWEKLDPTMSKTYSGATTGQGAVYAWEGKGKVGAGRMEILESIASSRITIKLDFIKPFEGHNTTVFKLEADGASTKVSWTMSGPHRYMARLMTVFFNMDAMIGKDFETGLFSLKALVEK